MFRYDAVSEEIAINGFVPTNVVVIVTSSSESFVVLPLLYLKHIYRFAQRRYLYLDFAMRPYLHI